MLLSTTKDIANQKKRTKTEAAPQKVKFDQAYVKSLGKTYQDVPWDVLYQGIYAW